MVMHGTADKISEISFTLVGHQVTVEVETEYSQAKQTYTMMSIVM